MFAGGYIEIKFSTSKVRVIGYNIDELSYCEV